jgi:Cof subfamily protein (haloacid dehalogenase superfamily)
MHTLPAGLEPGGRFSHWTPSPITYVVTDVDGTLVGIHDDVRADVREAIAGIIGAGIPVGYATGRMQDALGDLDAVLKLPGPHVVHNGAVVRANGETAVSWPLTQGEVTALVAIAADLDAYGEFYLEQGYLVTRPDPRARVHWELLGEGPRGLASELGTQQVIKATFIAFSEQERTELVDAILAAGISTGPAESLLTPGLTYVNATSAGVDKGRALAAAAELAGTTLAQTLAVGDGANDLEMLHAAGTSVAMGQASAQVKQAAHLVTTHVDAGGLAVALTSLVQLVVASSE